MRKKFLNFIGILISISPLSADILREDSQNIVFDTATALMWQDDISVKTIKKDYSAALSHCKNLKLAGFSDWRLPIRMELLSISDDTKYKPAIKNGFKNIATDEYYWTSSFSVSHSNAAWVVYFERGGDSGAKKATSGYVRCVRE